MHDGRSLRSSDAVGALERARRLLPRARHAFGVCVAALLAACARGGAGGGPAWSITGDDEPDAPAVEGQADAFSAGSVVVASPSLPASPNVVTAAPPQLTEETSGDAKAAPEEASGDSSGDDASGDDASAGDASVDDASGDDTSMDDAPVGNASADEASVAFAGAQDDDSGVALGSASPPPPLPSPAAPDVFVAALGDLLITEVMFAPIGPRPQAEWFEVYNTADTPRLLSGLTILDGSMQAHTIASGVASGAPVVAPPGAYVLLVRDRATAIANGLPPDAIVYEYGAGLAPDQGVQLDDGATGAISLWNAGLELAGAPYGSWGLVAVGQSVELSALQLVGSDTGASWCYGELPWAPGSDYGTPGAVNDCESASSP